jgi:prepilin-type N-terminal cleavage/methylation domain-containing protein
LKVKKQKVIIDIVLEALIKKHFPPGGFTLIEMLVVIGIISTLTSLGIASYSSYNALQTVESNATTVATQLGSAKSQAISQVIPSSCGANPLTGYQVNITVNSQQYTVAAVCGTQQVVSTNKLPPELTFTAGSTATVFFSVSTGAVANTATINITGYGKTKTITVSNIGNISVN